ncbi:TetR/AcrR family transcriptional regulator [Humibacillus xanthopallidus]|uniref:TetR/AcrR family transcriptional regulator n=1 Tax=Humibacillus xanthopallidus TaxID=412689 RepID=UPI00163ADE8E|nr:TetR/AcrR family transcriptional regulator [Humibacillus xanthopallidus]
MAVAVALADAEGQSAVSMRRLARELGVTPMALYWHFSDKDALVGAMAEQVIRDAEFTDAAGGGWQDRYRGVLVALVELLHAHPWMGRLVIERVVPLPNFLTALESMLDCLRLAGLDPTVSVMVVQQSVQGVVGLVEYEPQPPADAATSASARQALQASLGSLEPSDFPNVRAASVPLAASVGGEAYYRLGLDTIVGGIEAVAAAAAGPPRDRARRGGMPSGTGGGRHTEGAALEGAEAVRSGRVRGPEKEK